MNTRTTKQWLVISIVLAIGGRAWAQEFAWVNRITTKEVTTNRYGNWLGWDVVGTDPEGNVYTVASARGSSETEVTGRSSLVLRHDAMVVTKYDSTGGVIWQRDIGGGAEGPDNLPRIWSLAVDNRGDFWIAGELYTNNTVLKGKTRQIQLTSEDEYAVGFLAKYDREGELLWARSMQHYSTRGTGLVTDQEGNLYMTGYFGQRGILLDDNTTLRWGMSLSNFFIAKYDRSANLLRARSGNNSSGGSSEDRNHIALDIAGNAYVTGNFNGYSGAVFSNSAEQEIGITLTSSVPSNIFLIKYTPQGNIAWGKSIGTGGKYNPDTYVHDYASILSIATDFTGTGVYLSGYHSDAVTFDKGRTNEQRLPPRQVFIARLNQHGNVVWLKGIEVAEQEPNGCRIAVNRDNNVYAIGHYYKSVTFNKGLPTQLQLTSPQAKYHHTYIAKFSGEGRFGWAVAAKGDSGVYHSRLAVTHSGKVYAAGTISGKSYFGDITVEVPPLPKGAYSNSTGYIFALTDAGVQYDVNQVKGNIYEDANADCRKGSDEKPLEGIVVKAEPGPYYASTDSLGNYTLYLDTGRYTISQVIPRDLIGLKSRQTCPVPPGDYSVSFNSRGKDTTGFDFGNQMTRIPLLKVDIAADRRRRCFRNTTTVLYRNTGYAAAGNVQVKLYYPSYVVPLRASIPWSSKQDSLLIFNLGTLQPGEGGTITLTDSVICGNEAIRGLTQCVKAVITPKNNPQPDPRWDQSDVTLKAACRDNGIVRLAMLNSGKGNMADSAAYRVYLDAQLIFSRKYQLNRQDSLVLQVLANGKTVRLEADLRPYHPDGNRRPSVTLEGCGSGAAPVSKGYVCQLPPDDAPEEVAVSCLPIIDSYDPNDKLASPEGVGSRHLVREGEEIEYLVRFQNTGTDLAYTVVIQDTLDEHLDIAALEVGAASHPFTWHLSGKGKPVITWTFRNINLPDSTSNEPQSHGYVRFRIGQKPGNPLGTVITNQAAIVFDYNSPIVTNLVTHQVGVLPAGELAGQPVDICYNNHPSMAQAGPDQLLNELNTAFLGGNQPAKGQGCWKLIRGKGTLADPANPRTEVRDLGVGRNIFEWQVTLCDSTTRSRVTVERVVIPAPPVVVSPDPICADAGLPLLSARGQAIAWYGDAAGKQLLMRGTTYQPSIAASAVFYVTQTVEGYESSPAAVQVAVKPVPETPAVRTPAPYCAGEVVAPLVASGTHVQWYQDAALCQRLAAGNTYQPLIEKTTHFFVSQTVDGCESKPAEVVVTILPRPQAPPAESPARLYCEGEKIQPLSARGENLQWYADKALSRWLASGAGYEPAVAATTAFFVTQTVNGCRSEPATVVVKVQPATFTLHHSGDTLVAPEAESFQWYFEGVLLPKATGAQHVARNTGHYRVVIRKGPCKAIAEDFFHAVHIANRALQLFPNPATDAVTVTFTANATGLVKLNLRNPLGTSLKQVSVAKVHNVLEYSLDLRDVPSGMYFIEVVTSEGTSVAKVLKQ